MSLFVLQKIAKIHFTAERVCSILTDFGVEKDAWFTPGFGDVEQSVSDGEGDTDPANLDANLLFRFNMPLPDADHSLHHASCQSFIFFLYFKVVVFQRHCVW